MTVGIVVTLVVFLGGALVVAVARDSGPTPTDVAIGYGSALAHSDFDAVYRMTDPDVLHGQNRLQWIAEHAARPRAVIDPAAVVARSAVVTADTARVVIDVDAAGGTAVVELVCRDDIWVVGTFMPTTAPR